MPTIPALALGKSLSDLCTFGIGGPARYFASAATVDELRGCIEYAHEQHVPFIVLGKGSNCLFDDRGYNGLVILNKVHFLERPKPNIFYAGAGYSFSLLGVQSARQGYAGLEFASGIPGSVGGAVYMNAGANTKETCETLHTVDYLFADGRLENLKKDELEFAYRYSSFQKMEGIIVAAAFYLIESPTAREKQIEIINYRKKTQPLWEMSAGCIFRNPSCGHAGALIDQCGLKGKTIGGAAVSDLHGNFIINKGGATAREVLALIAVVQEEVRKKTQTELDCEVRYIPYEGDPS
jgi:UDP-N-acetylmuramate dehydrogenase